MAVNKVILGERTLIDISDSTVTPETLLGGETAYNAAGEKITGTMEVSAGGVETCTMTLSGYNHGFSGYIYYLKLVNGDIKLAVTPELSTLNGSSIIDNIVKGSIIALTDIYHTYIPSYVESNDIGTNLIQVDSGNVFQIVGDVTMTGIYCFVEGSHILTGFNTSKPVEDITYDDDLLVWDFDNACFTYAKPCWIKKEETAPFYYKCTFLDGTELKLVGSNGKCHRVFSLDDNMFLSATDCVGKRVATINGASTLVSCERVDESVKYYNVITNHYINLFAENVLTSCRLNNMYPISDNKEYIKDGREVRPYSEFEAVGIKKYWYDTLRLGESVATIKEITEYINRLEAKMAV